MASTPLSGHMDGTADELAGVVDLFGGLTRGELERALTEIAFRADGQSVDDTAMDGAIDEAIDSYALIRYDAPTVTDVEDPLLVSGPTAFPRTPDHAEDVPHILGIEPRRLDRTALGAAVKARYEHDVDRALESPDELDPDHLIDIGYDIDAWAPVDTSAERRRLAQAIESDAETG